MKIYCLCLALFSVCLHAEKSYTLRLDQGVSVDVIEFSAEENIGFEFVSSDREKLKFAASDHYNEDAHTFIINGGYFDGNLRPVGFCQIGGVVLSTEKADKLSGFISTTETGEIYLHWKSVPEKAYRDIVQSGPFVIDPGGKVGIHTRTGKPAKRTLIGMTFDKKVLILTTSEVYLYDLAKMLKEAKPELERVLNLDGGPSVARIYGESQALNAVPVSNFLRRRK